MNSKLYVGNLTYEVQECDLKNIFENEGPVKSVNLIMDQYTGKSKGFGFIEMESSTAAENAQKNLDGAQFMGRTIRVNAAIERENKREERSRY